MLEALTVLSIFFCDINTAHSHPRYSSNPWRGKNVREEEF
jgi:hypothetical protein